MSSCTEGGGAGGGAGGVALCEGYPYLEQLVENPHDKEAPLLVCESQVVSDVHPEGFELSHAIVPQGQPLGDDVTMDTLGGVWLSQQGHAEAAKVGPEQEVE